MPHSGKDKTKNESPCEQLVDFFVDEVFHPEVEHTEEEYRKLDPLTDQCALNFASEKKESCKAFSMQLFDLMSKDSGRVTENDLKDLMVNGIKCSKK